MWPGATVSFEAGSKHNRAVLRFGEAEQFVTYPSSPSDNGRALYNHVSDIRRTLIAMGAERAPRPKSDRPRSERNPGAAMRELPVDGPAQTFRDPWEALKGLVKSSVVYHHDIEQGTLDWLNLRKGRLTASEMKLIVTPTLKVANNDEVRKHLYDLLAQRITDHVEPHFQSYDMERGNFDEEHARAKYSETYGEVTECGFVTNDKIGFTIGYSPDGLVGDDGLIECKSRLQKLQMHTLIEFVANKMIPPDYLIQCQAALFVADDREWLDFISYSGGMKMAAVRCYPDPKIHEAIGNAAIEFEAKLAEKREIYEKLIASDARLVDTERLIYL